MRAFVSVALAVGVIAGPAGHAAAPASALPTSELCRVPAADAPPRATPHGLPATFCVRTVEDLAAYVRASGSPIASWLAPRLRRAASGPEDRFCLPGSVSGWMVSPDLTGDGRRDVVAISLVGCTPAITMTMRLVDGRSGRLRWHASVTSFLPLPYLTELGSPQQPGVLVESYDWSWQLARLHGRTYHGTALAAAAFNSHGRRVWHLAVPADVNADQSYTAPTDAQYGRLISRHSVDLVYSRLNGAPVDLTGVEGLGSPTVTNVFVDGRTGRSSPDPTITPALLTPTYPQVVGDIDGDGRDDYLLIGGFEIASPVGVIIPGVGTLPPTIHRLVIEAHNARNHAAMWSQTLNLPVWSFFSLVRDFDGDQWPEISGLVFPDWASGEESFRSLLLSGANGNVLINREGWAVDVLRRGLRTPLLALASPYDDGTSAGVLIDAYAINGWHRRVAALRVAYPTTNANYSGSLVAMIGEGDLDSDGLDELGLIVETNSGPVRRHASELLGSNLSVHQVHLAFNPLQRGWQPLYASIKGRGDDLYSVQHEGRTGWQVDVDAGLDPRELLRFVVSSRQRPAEVYPSVLSGSDSKGCRALVVGAWRDRSGGPMTLLRVGPGTGQVRWQRTVFGARFPVRANVASHVRCGAHA